jgi:hypothetical protein
MRRPQNGAGRPLPVEVGHSVDDERAVAGDGHERVVAPRLNVLDTTSLVSGLADRMKRSEQQVHSSPFTRMTGLRGLVAIAWALFGAKAGPRPGALAVGVRIS